MQKVATVVLVAEGRMAKLVAEEETAETRPDIVMEKTVRMVLEAESESKVLYVRVVV